LAAKVDPAATAAPALEGGLEVRVISGPKQTPVVGASLTFAETLDPTDAGRTFRGWYRAGELDRNLAAQTDPLPVHTVTDDEGRARVPHPERSAVIVAA